MTTDMVADEYARLIRRINPASIRPSGTHKMVLRIRAAKISNGE